MENLFKIFATEFLDNLEDMFLMYYIHSDVCSIIKHSTLLSNENGLTLNSLH